MVLEKNITKEPDLWNKTNQWPQEFDDVFWDDDLIKRLFPKNNIKIIFSEDFMNKSKEFYSELPRLGRELIQNFIDANNESPGTLNGVDIQHKQNGDNNTISIRWNRIFNNPTALYKLDSWKVDDKNKAGGNGIWLKQTVLVLFRDYNIQEFIIRGETWDLEYKFLRKKEINQQLEEEGVEGKVKKWWLIANVTPVAKRDFTEYEIKTQGWENDDVFNGLQNIKNYGIHREHPALQDLDVEISEVWWFKFLENPKQMWEFFLNGQKFRCKSDRIQEETKRKKGSIDSNIEEEYRWWPTGMNMWIIGDYQMSIDRQPIGSENIAYYLNKLLYLIPDKDLVNCLLKTNKTWLHLIDKEWQFNPYRYYSRSSDIPVLEHFIYKLVGRLSEKKYDTHNLKTLLNISSKQKYPLVACNVDSTNQLESLSKKWYILVPEYFSKIGIPLASLLIQEQESEINSEQIYESHEKQAMTIWVSVPYREFWSNGLKNRRLYYGHLSQWMGKSNVLYNDDSQTLLIQYVSDHCSKKDLYRIKTTEKINDIRWLFVLWKKKGFFDSFILYACGRKAEFNFKEDEEELFVKLSDTDKNYQYTSIEIQSGEFSREVIDKWTKKNTRKDFKEAGSSGISEKWIKSPFNKVVNGMMVAMMVGFMFFGSNYVVKNFSKLSNLSYQTWEGITFQDMIDVWFEDIRDLFSWKKDIEDFINKYNQADIKIWTKNLKIRELENIVARQKTSPEEQLLAALQREPIEDFKIIDNLSENQKKQIDVLKTYVEVCLWIDVNNKLFLFDGKGTKGVNIGGIKIGLHKSMMDVEFFEALKTFVHEIAHNYILDHSNHFINANGALLVAMTERYDNLMDELLYDKNKSKNLTDEEKFIITANQYRNSLR